MAPGKNLSEKRQMVTKRENMTERAEGEREVLGSRHQEEILGEVQYQGNPVEKY